MKFLFVQFNNCPLLKKTGMDVSIVYIHMYNKRELLAVAYNKCI